MMNKKFYLKLKLRLPTLLKHKKKLKSVDADLDEYVDVSWKYCTKTLTPHESLTAALATLPHYDVMESWLAGCDNNPCDQSQCDMKCDVVDEHDGEAGYACVESQLSCIESH